MFFSVRGTLITAAVSLIVVVVAGLVIPGLTVRDAILAARFSITAVPLVILAVSHRNRLEKIRRAQMQAANEALMRSEAELEQRVIERTAALVRAREDAEEARQRAEKADQVKSQFLASMSHELRTPLNAILNFTEMMSLGMVGDVSDLQKDLLGKSLRSGRHLLDLINDVLDVSKMQSGMLTLFLEEGVDVQAELESVVDAAQSLLKNKPVTLVEEIERPLPLITGDRRRIRQILLNLISNAVKFTDDGTITLSARRMNGDLLFGVADTGPGIAPEQQARIFLPFVQTENGVRHVGGTGLGLAISKYLAEAHGGRLWVESEPGHGAVFFASLPIRAGETQAEEFSTREVER
jgi:signal transduction histidine kinase